MWSYVFLLNSSSVLTVSVLLIIATYAAYLKWNIQHWVVAHSTVLANFLQWTQSPRHYLFSLFFCISLSVSFFCLWKIKQKQEEIANLWWRKFKESILFFLLFLFLFFCCCLWFQVCVILQLFMHLSYIVLRYLLSHPQIFFALFN